MVPTLQNRQNAGSHHTYSTHFIQDMQKYLKSIKSKEVFASLECIKNQGPCCQMTNMAVVHFSHISDYKHSTLISLRFRMFSMKVTRRMVDPITFVERVNVECIPRMEDSFLDDQLGCSMAYFPPKHVWSTPLEARKESLPGNFRPPTPPRGPGDANSPRDPSASPVAMRRRLKLAGRTKSSLTKKPDIGILPFLSQAGERNELGEGSMSDMSVQLTSLRIMPKQEENGLKCVRFADEHDLNIISPMRNSVIAEIFWASDDLANFRYEAFMEKAGLDVSDFD